MCSDDAAESDQGDGAAGCEGLGEREDPDVAHATKVIVDEDIPYSISTTLSSVMLKP